MSEKRHIHQGALTRHSGYWENLAVWVTLASPPGAGAHSDFGYLVRIKSWPAVLMVRIKRKPWICNPNNGPPHGPDTGPVPRCSDFAWLYGGDFIVHSPGGWENDQRRGVVSFLEEETFRSSFFSTSGDPGFFLAKLLVPPSYGSIYTCQLRVLLMN
ncbi:hypothetical protein BDP55DRAFT_729689 [Colletotrichum godetiae]|uniref:Uncharacterized protein n=1 Tax=Colletotrichum godetiae TaxID=1209918 RepID=A0AAJ0AI37_9PEZI|nr:uncharacterized protein BDP55DRAFT_729689 [Colletotrichum godetiae]KAK1674295.1 hypothetical protein BDP55DRAFT_729689 [Colletotrichum godetiae]